MRGLSVPAFGFSSGVGVSSSPTPPSSTPIMTAAFGDSITNYNSYNVSPTLMSAQRGYVTQLNTLMNNKFVLPPQNNKAVAGRTASQVATALATDFLACPFAFTHAWLMAGRNSVTDDVSAASIIGSLTNCLDYLVDTQGKSVFLQTILPGTYSANEAARKQVVLDVNSWIMAQDGTRSGKVISINTFSGTEDGSGNPIANILSDGVHPNSYGAYVIAGLMKTKLEPSFPSLSLPDWAGSGNLILNPLLTGTGGTVEGGFTGSSATNWRMRALNGTTAGRVSSKGSEDEQVFAQNIASSSNQKCRLQQDVTTGFNVGDTLYGAMLIKIDDSPVGLDDFTLWLALTGTGVSGYTTSKWGELQPSETFALGRGYYLIKTPNFTISAGSAMTLSLYLEGGKASASANSSFTIRVKAAGIFKDTAYAPA